MKKRMLILLSLIISAICANAQSDDVIFYHPVVDGQDMPEQARQALIAKMDKALTLNGLGTDRYADRFVMLARCNVVEKNVAPTTPPRITQTIEVTFTLGDVIENKTYASNSFELKGIGTNETKAWQTALSKLKPSDDRIARLFESVSEKIKSYYSSNCSKIIAEARTLASLGEYDHAIAMLMSIPGVCADCQNEASAVATVIHQQKVDAEGKELLIKAKNAWLLSPDATGADTAMSYLNKIALTSASFGAAKGLAAAIGDKMSSDRAREWNQQLKEYNDEKDYRRREQANRHARSMATIKACRSIAEKWAENQPQNTVYLNW